MSRTFHYEKYSAFYTDMNVGNSALIDSYWSW